MVYKYFSNKNIFKRHKFASQKGSNIEYFGPSAPTMRGLYVWLNYPYTNVKKIVCTKHLDTALLGTDWEGEVKDFLEGGGGIWKGADKYPVKTMDEALIKLIKFTWMKCNINTNRVHSGKTPGFFMTLCQETPKNLFL